MNLDAPGSYAQVDAADALADVEASWQQWAQAPRLQPLDLSGVTAVVVTGMGGSGIAGAVVRELAADRLTVPVIAQHRSTMPAFVGPATVVLAVSYSGNTDETLSAVEVARSRGARLAGVSSGGGLVELGSTGGFPVARVPAGRMPRHSLGYLVVPLLAALELDEAVPEAVAILQQLGTSLGRHVPLADNPAKSVGRQLARGGVPLLWGTEGLASVAAYRLRCQLNENAKLVAHSAELPELDHNEIVGWQEATTGMGTLVALRDPASEDEAMRSRVEASTDLVAHGVAGIRELRSVGTSPTARLASLLMQADLVSVYTALELDRDPTPIPAIDRLKQLLRVAAGTQAEP